MTRFKLKSSQTFLAIKVERGQKLEKLLRNHEAQNKSGAIYGTIVIFLLIFITIFLYYVSLSNNLLKYIQLDIKKLLKCHV
jgi:hypothetical protein